MRPLPAALCSLLACIALAPGVWAQDETVRKTVEIAVGQTRQIGIYGGHRPDCVTSTAPDTIDVVQPPRLGTLTQRQGVPYVNEHSMSGTCLGGHFTGTAVDYTARSPGIDTVGLDVRFRNGTSHREITIRVIP